MSRQPNSPKLVDRVGKLPFILMIAGAGAFLPTFLFFLFFLKTYGKTSSAGYSSAFSNFTTYFYGAMAVFCVGVVIAGLIILIVRSRDPKRKARAAEVAERRSVEAIVRGADSSRRRSLAGGIIALVLGISLCLSGLVMTIVGCSYKESNFSMLRRNMNEYYKYKGEYNKVSSNGIDKKGTTMAFVAFFGVVFMIGGGVLTMIGKSTIAINRSSGPVDPPANPSAGAAGQQNRQSPPNAANAYAPPQAPGAARPPQSFVRPGLLMALRPMLPSDTVIRSTSVTSADLIETVGGIKHYHLIGTVRCQIGDAEKSYLFHADASVGASGTVTNYVVQQLNDPESV